MGQCGVECWSVVDAKLVKMCVVTMISQGQVDFAWHTSRSTYAFTVFGQVV